MKTILKTNNITKTYNGYNAVNSISININKGDIYGLVGRNGAGKTTLMKMITNLSNPTSGSYEVFGESPKRNPKMLKKIGCLIEAPGIFPDMTAKANIHQKCNVLGISNKKYEDELLDLVGLSDAKNKKAKDFSLGMKQRLGIALALVGDPELLILDEPINGLDPQGIAQVRDMILKLNKEKGITILISSHILEELSKICTHFGFINKGVLVEEDTSKELYDKCKDYAYIKTDDISSTTKVLKEMGIDNFKLVDETTLRLADHINETAKINKELVTRGVNVTEIYADKSSLEEYFLNLTGGIHDA